MTYVNSQANVARGIKVKIGNTYIGEICTDGVPIPQVEVDDIEVTNQDSGDWKEYLAGRKDGGECEIKCNAVDSDAGQIALKNAYTAGTAHLFTNEFGSGSNQTFYAVVKTYDHIIEDDIIKLSCKLKVSGAPEFSTTASALTGLTVKIGAVAQSLTPAFAADKFLYLCNVANGTTAVNVTPVQAATGATFTVNGVTATHNTDSEVTLGDAGTITTVDVMVKETSKTAKVYTVHIYRAAD